MSALRKRIRLPLFLSVAVLLGLRVACPTVATAQATRRDDALRQQRDRLVEAFHADINTKIKELREEGLTDGLPELTVWLEPVNHELLTQRSLPRARQPEIPFDLPAAQREWRVWLRKRREDLAADLYVLSRRAVRTQSPGFAWELIHEVVWFDPDHQNARHLLGDQEFENEWVTPFEAQMRRSNPPRVWHDRFGWLPVNHVERYENGERQFNSRWLPADLEAERRHDFRYAWEVETDHFLIKTNVSQERGVELAGALEHFHDWFQRSFPELFTSPGQLNEALQRGTSRRGPRRRPPFVVHFYRTKEDYVSRLIKKNPSIEITNGIYMPDERIAHFYFDPDNDTESSLYHEATHQILFELQAVPHDVGLDANFWVIEGFACYMESFRQKNGQTIIGTPSNPRFYWAKHRLVDENFFVPLEQLSRLGRQPFQAAGTLRQLYSQSSGLAHFFLHYQDGLYRDALIDYIAAIYGPESRRGTIPGLDHLTGVAYRDLDQQYRSYITELDTEDRTTPVESQ
ncbi:hypothetical protein GC176_02805 [bacterium]|nr:hypothetical protein [bacterium]